MYESSGLRFFRTTMKGKIFQIFWNGSNILIGEHDLRKGIEILAKLVFSFSIIVWWSWLYYLSWSWLLKLIYLNSEDFFCNQVFNWDSIHASYCEVWSYKKKKYKTFKTYDNYVWKEPIDKRCLLILDLKPCRS